MSRQFAQAGTGTLTEMPVDLTCPKQRAISVKRRRWEVCSVNIKQLRYFVAVAKYLNFSEAAKHLNIAQPALSHSIGVMEEDLDLKLFYRDKRSVRLTAAGEMFLQEAIEIINKYDQAIEKVRQMHLGLSGGLKLGFLGTLIKRDFPQWIPAFCKKYPNIGLSLEQLSRDMLREKLEKGIIDIGFTHCYTLMESSGLAWKKISDDHICLVMHKDYPLAGLPQIDFSSLGSVPLIVLQEAHKKIMEHCAELGFVPNVTYAPSSMETVFTLLDAKLGIAIVPYSCKYISGSNLVFVKSKETLDYVVAWRKSNGNPAIPLFLEEIGATSPTNQQIQ
jgi:DNA-binding transcriptional LysR family regulator